MRLTTQTLRGLTLGSTCGLMLTVAAAGCGGSDDGGNPPAVQCTADMVTGNVTKYATNALLLPKTSGSMTYAADLDGSGKQKNQLKVLVQAVAVAGLNIQDTVNTAVANGEAVILQSLQAPDLMNSSCFGLTLGLAQTPAMGSPLPKFDGSDTFQLSAGTNAKLYGSITSGSMSTIASKDQTATTEQQIDLQLPIGSGQLLPLSLHGVQIQGTLGTDQKGNPIITNGVINGAISENDIMMNIVPTVANIITGMINANPTDSTTQTIISLFENMANQVTQQKCMDMTKCCKTNPKTCVILPQEVLMSPVGGVLSPDVQVFDANGNWDPTPNGKTPNGMSVGLGFTSIKANF